MKIKKTVGGKVGNGRRDDVKVVQDLLNRHASAVGYKKLEVDGLVGKRTLKTIARFQDAAVPEIRRADAKVDPGNLTIRALNQSPGEIAKLIKEGGGLKVPGVVMKVKGKDVEVPYNEYAKLARKALDDIRRGIYLDAKSKVTEARDLWDHFHQVNKNPWLDEVIHAFGSFGLPSQSVIKAAESALSRWEASLKSGDAKKAKSAMAAAEKPLNDAIREMAEYRDKVVGQAGSWITGLDITKSVSYAMVSAFASASVGSVSAASGWGSAIALAESSASEAGKHSAGDKKQPLGSAMQSLTTNTCLNALSSSAGKAQVVKQMSKVGGPIGAKALAKQAPRLSKTVDPEAMAEYFVKSLVGPSYATLEKSVTKTVKALKMGEKDTTWEKIIEHSITTIAGETVFKKLEDLMSKKLPDDIAQQIFKGMLDKHLQSFLKTTGVTKSQLFKENSKAIKAVISKGITGPLAAFYALAVQEALKKGKGTESAEQLHRAALAIFMNHAKALKVMADLIEKQIGPQLKKR